MDNIVVVAAAGSSSIFGQIVKSGDKLMIFEESDGGGDGTRRREIQIKHKTKRPKQDFLLFAASTGQERGRWKYFRIVGHTIEQWYGG